MLKNIRLEDIISTSLDISNYVPLQKLFTDYESKLQQALENYKANNTLEPITGDIKQGEDIILSVEMQEINQDYNIKKELAKDAKIEITEDNLNTYFKQKEKTELENMREKQLRAESILLDVMLGDTKI